MKIEVGKVYRDGFGREHRIVGPVPSKPGVFWADSREWFCEDGRLHFRVSAELCKFDLTETPPIGPELTGLGVVGPGPACGPEGCSK